MHHKDLDVWKVSMELTTEIYILTSCFPKDEMYGLVRQIRKSVVSIPSNIAEGAGRRTAKEYKHFLSIAQGSLSELETQIMIGKNINMISEIVYNDLIKKIIRIRQMLRKQISSL